MLKNDFYEVVSMDHSAQQVSATIRLNPGHAIFTGHFPGQPVLPGVCMLQIVKEMFESSLEQQLILTQSRAIKFLSVVNPNDTPELSLTIRYTGAADEGWQVDAAIAKAETACFKMKGIYKVLSSATGQPGS